MKWTQNLSRRFKQRTGTAISAIINKGKSKNSEKETRWTMGIFNKLKNERPKTILDTFKWTTINSILGLLGFRKPAHFGDNSSEILDYTLYVYNSKLFGLRNREDHHDLKVANFCLGSDCDGQRIIEYTSRKTKTSNGGLIQRHFEAKI